MRIHKAIVCGIAIVSFLGVQSPLFAQTTSSAAAKTSIPATQNAPQIKTTPPEPIAAGKSDGGGKKVLWGVLGAAALIGLIAAVVGGGGGGGGGNGDNPPRDDPDTGSVQVEW